MTDLLADLAKDALTHFHKHRRDNGDEIWISDDEPKWVKDLLWAAHGDMLPDDWKYEFTYEALDIIATTSDDNHPNIEADISTHRLLRWLASNGERIDYTDEAWDEYEGNETGIFAMMTLGQLRERFEVFDIVDGYLRAMVADLEAQEDPDDA